MIHDQYFSMFLWEEACNTTVYIQNRNHHKILEENTPEEAFTGVKSEVSHLRIFGFPMYIHVLEENRTKMDLSTIKGVFLGYNETLKAYMIFIPAQRRTVVRQYMKL